MGRADRPRHAPILISAAATSPVGDASKPDRSAEGRRAHVWVSGSVQGVFFRQKLAQRARERAVSGWVRNLSDGRVEALLEGYRDDVAAVIGWCREGPRNARVDAVDVVEESPQGSELGFEVRW